VLGGFCTPVFGGFSGSSPSGAEKAEFRNAKRGTPFFVSYMLFFFGHRPIFLVTEKMIISVRISENAV